MRKNSCQNLVAAWILLAAFSLTGLGCGSSKFYPVAGTVTYNGVPVERGSISLISTDPGVPPEGAVIEQGKFSLEATAGPKRVEIRGSRPLPPELQDTAGAVLYEDFIPASFNEQSTLTHDVGPGSRVVAFDLKGE